MRLLYISKYQFVKNKNGTYTLPAYGDAFWEKYLDVFEGIDVLAENIKNYLNNGTLSEITDDRINVNILPENTNPKDFKNDNIIKKELYKFIKNADAVLVKPASRKGIMAIKICESLRKPYMVELTGDLNLTLRNHSNPLKRIYSPIIHCQILNAIKNCKFGLYVTESYLQKVYPISGEQCGCTDTYIPDPDFNALQKRLEKIDRRSSQSITHIGLVASYHDSRKGLDTALDSLKLLNNDKVFLHVLGLGTEDDRNKWYAYAEKLNIKNQLIFDSSLSGIEKVLAWNDTIDITILPSRSEGLPRCIVESISRACPCVISNVCGMPELVNEKWLHNPNDSRKLAQLLNEMISDKQKMRDAAVENFNHSQNYRSEVLKEKRNRFLNKFMEYCARC